MKKILIIDDSEAIREELATLLKLEEYEVLEAEDGLQAVEMAVKHMPDLIISDILLPEMDGFEELTELRRNPNTSDIPFIFLTGMNSIKFRMLGLGAEDYFIKPYDPVVLLKRIKSLLKNHLK